MEENKQDKLKETEKEKENKNGLVLKSDQDNLGSYLIEF